MTHPRHCLPGLSNTQHEHSVDITVPTKTQPVNAAIGTGPAACNLLVSLAVTQLACFDKLSRLAGVAYCRLRRHVWPS